MQDKSSKIERDTHGGYMFTLIKGGQRTGAHNKINRPIMRNGETQDQDQKLK